MAKDCVSTKTVADGAGARTEWAAMLERLAGPVLSAIERGQLKATLPPALPDRSAESCRFGPTEAFCRLTTGLSAWIAAPADGLSPEEELRRQHAEQSAYP